MMIAFLPFLFPILPYICRPFGSKRLTWNGPVAQLNRASDYGSEGFRFES